MTDTVRFDRFQSLPRRTNGFLDTQTGFVWFPEVNYRPRNDGSGIWFVESKFFGICWAVTDDFGNLVRVPS